MNDDEQRKAFESWMITEHCEDSLSRVPETERYGAGQYVEDSTFMAWKAWQASAEHCKKTSK